MIGLAVGLFTGGLQFWLLSRFTKSVTGGAMTHATVLLGLLQLFLPFAVLAGIAFLRRQDLLWTGIGITGALLGGVLVRAALKALGKKERGEQAHHD